MSCMNEKSAGVGSLTAVPTVLLTTLLGCPGAPGCTSGTPWALAVCTHAQNPSARTHESRHAMNKTLPIAFNRLQPAESQSNVGAEPLTLPYLNEADVSVT